MTHTHEQVHQRRTFLRTTAGVALGLCASPLVLAAPTAAVKQSGERRIALYNIHTGESLNTVYWQDGIYIPESLSEINHLLRDRRNNAQTQMDPHLIETLNKMNKMVGGKRPYNVISGYRSPETNNHLRQASEEGGVAKKSLHMQGKAADIRLPKVELAYLRKAAVQMKQGGVGYYPKDGFIHVDVGRVRYWGQPA